MISLTDMLCLALIILQLAAILILLLRNPSDAAAKTARENREELSRSLNGFAAVVENRFKSLQEQIHTVMRDNRQEFTVSRQELNAALQAIRSDNAAQLEKMRATVDEKLQRTLETRLGQSFKLVSAQLEQVQKGLGEMNALAAGVGDLQKVLSNAKTKGVLGEFQLENILRQLLTDDQYGRNVKTKRGSADMVEFAVKIPSKNKDIPGGGDFIWLPIDAKFPTADYERLRAAYDAGDNAAAETHTAALAKRVKLSAKTIAEKYIDPPNTTEFAVMFLPFEGLYAEVLRISGLFEEIQREYRVTIAGPTTVSAFLNSLQMGFHSLAVEKRSSEVWRLLSTVRSEFEAFGGMLEKTREKIDQAGQELERAGVRSRAIERSLKKAESLPEKL